MNSVLPGKFRVLVNGLVDARLDARDASAVSAGCDLKDECSQGDVVHGQLQGVRGCSLTGVNEVRRSQ